MEKCLLDVTLVSAPKEAIIRTFKFSAWRYDIKGQEPELKRVDPNCRWSEAAVSAAWAALTWSGLSEIIIDPIQVKGEVPIGAVKARNNNILYINCKWVGTRWQ
jgi:hypothetical protein